MDFVKLVEVLSKRFNKDILFSGQQIHMAKKKFLLSKGPFLNIYRGEDRDLYFRLVHKNEWTSIMNNIWYQEHNDPFIYEFVIRRHTIISPLYEVNIFGFIKDVIIQQTVSGYDDASDDWEASHEYVFVADVFTPTDFYIHNEDDEVLSNTTSEISRNAVRSYGGYNMDEGTITTQELLIPFSQIRRLYLICGHEILGV